jgi:dUTP pyrophosphatase
MINVKVKLSHPDAKSPIKAHESDAGFDVYSVTDVIIYPHGTAIVDTGVHLGLPVGYEVQIRPRSGLAAKHGLTVLNSPATGDQGYTGEYKVIMINHGSEPFHITKGMRIAQMVIKPVPEVSLQLVDSLEETDRNADGFGSSGTH